MTQQKQDSQRTWIGVVMMISVGYATLRYNLCKGVPWADWPTWTLNKAFAVGSLALLLVAVIRWRRCPGASYSRVLSASVGMAAIHIVLSLLLMSPVYYAKFFVDDKLTAAAGWSMLLGGMAAVIMARRGKCGALSAKEKEPTEGVQKGVRVVGIVALLVAFHALLQGVSGWLDPGKWPGGLPPITLISFVLGVSTLLVVVWSGRSHSSLS